MAAGIWHLDIERGATYRKGFTILDETGQAMDLSAFAATATLLRNPDATVPMAVLTIGDGVEVGNGIDPPEGTGEEGAICNVVLTVPDDLTSTMSPSVLGFWKLELVSENGETDRALEGEIRVSP